MYLWVFLLTWLCVAADVAYIHERLRKYVSRAEAYSEAAGTRLQFVLLDMSPVTHLDTTGGLWITPTRVCCDHTHECVLSARRKHAVGCHRDGWSDLATLHQ